MTTKGFLTTQFSKNHKRISAVVAASLSLIGEDTRHGLNHKAKHAFEVVTAGREHNHKVAAWAGKFMGAVGSAAHKAATHTAAKISM